MEPVESYISAVAMKDGNILKKGDPMLCLHTILEKFEGDFLNSQQELLSAFQAALETEYAKWNAESTARAERVLSSSLAAAKKDADTVFRAAADEELALLGAALNEKLEEVKGYQISAKRIAVLSFICALLFLLSVVGMFLKL